MMQKIMALLDEIRQDLAQCEQDSPLAKQLEQKLDALVEMAFYDPVTGLPNRMQLMESLQKLMTEGQRSGKPLAVMFIDLDRFKYVNDTLGHQAGDALLRKVAERIQQQVRANDGVMRVGGDEFVIVLPNQAKLTHLGRLAQGLIERLSEPFPLNEGVAEIGASIGVAVWSPKERLSAEQLLDQADQAMDQAKQAGRGVVRFYNAELEAEAHQRLALEKQLWHALEEGLFQLVCDPVYFLRQPSEVPIELQEVDGIEVKWQLSPLFGHQSQPLCDALKFVDNRHLNEALGKRLLQSGLDFLQHLVELGVGRKLAVNVGAELLQNTDFPQWLDAALVERGLCADWLILELDEANFAQERVNHVNQMRALSDLGVGLTLDNVGAGAFPLSLLRMSEIDNVKLSASLVSNMLQEERDFQLVQGVIKLALALKKAVVADGVTTQEVSSVLYDLQCRIQQGDYFGEALTPEEMEARLMATVMGEVMEEGEDDDI